MSWGAARAVEDAALVGLPGPNRVGITVPQQNRETLGSALPRCCAVPSEGDFCLVVAYSR